MQKISVFILLFLLLTGCGANDTSRAVKPKNTAKAVIKDNLTSNYTKTDILKTRGGTRAKNKSGTVPERAARISSAVTGIEGIRKASVVITGNNAVIGIETVNEPDDAEVINRKKEVERKVKETDEQIDHVSVTAVAELVERISKMADSVNLNDNSQVYKNRPTESTEMVMPAF